MVKSIKLKKLLVKELFKKIIPAYKSFIQIDEKLNELVYANVFSDSIRERSEFRNLSLNIGRWSGGYPFFYVLGRILTMYKPMSILELGLGESTKFIASFNKSVNPKCNHVVVEHDIAFINAFESNSISYTKIENLELETRFINECPVLSYKNFQSLIDKKYDLYIIDGPFGSKRFSRFDIISAVKSFNNNDEFIIILDDTNRIGERETFEFIIKILTNKGLQFYSNSYSGIKTSSIIVSERYKLAASL